MASFLKKLGALKLAFAVFGILFLFILIVEKPGSGSMEKVLESQPFLFPRLNLDSVTHISLTPVRQELPIITLRASSEGWFLDDAPVEPEKADALVATIHDLKQELVVSKNPSKQLLFGVDPTAPTTRIQVWKDSKELIAFYVGNSVGVGSQYLRLQGENQVLQASPSLHEFLGLQVSDWVLSAAD